MPGHYVYRLARLSPVLVGVLEESGSFSYDSGYLARADAAPLSLSLPLGEGAFDVVEARPYFEGLLAEGQARATLASELALSEEDWLSLLVICGRECVGDVLVCDDPCLAARADEGYASLGDDELRGMFLGDSQTARENVTTRLSLAGTQSKTALAHMRGMPIDEGWLRPMGLSASTHILKTSHLRDLPEVEYLCMSAAAFCGMAVAQTALLDVGNPVLAIERFDRRVSTAGERLVVGRLHQEDMAQAMGITGGSKYAELEGGSVRAMAELLRRRSVSPARDVASLAQMVCLAFLAGNCDAHLKNYAILHERPARDGGAHVSLAPAYDVVSTTYFPNHPRRLAMRIGGAPTIDEVDADSFRALARELGVRDSALRRLATPLVEGLADGIRRAGEGAFGTVLASTPYVAEDLVEDMAPRLGILSEYCTAAG